jgi:hypothetical protein
LQSTTKKPMICSLVSANGPSAIMCRVQHLPAAVGRSAIVDRSAAAASRTSPFGRQPLPTLCAPAKVIDENSAVVIGIWSAAGIAGAGLCALEVAFQGLETLGPEFGPELLR